jgi:hypothetical protein
MSSNSERSYKSIVTVDRDQPHFFEFDKAVEVGEIPLSKKFAVEFIDENGIVISADTSLLYEDKFRVVLAKNETINEGDKVQLSLTAVHKKIAHDYFLKIPSALTKVEQFDHVTHAEITFSEETDVEFTAWYQQWLAKFKSVKNRDEINRDAFNFLFQYYKRLYCDHLAYPILFSDEKEIQRAYLSKAASLAISFTTEHESDARLPINVIQPYITLPSKINRIPLYVWYEDNQIHYFSKADYPKVSPKNIISWLTKKPQWRVLLVRNRKMVFADELQRKEIVQYFTDDISQNDSDFEDDFFKLCISTNILDISCLFKEYQFPEYQHELEENKEPLSELDVDYHRISFKIKRTEARYDFTTKVLLITLGGLEEFDAETTNVSLLGLNIRIPLANCSLQERDTIRVDFTQWNDEIPKKLLQKKEEIDPVEYKITNINRKKDHIILGIKLVIKENNTDFNRFFKNKVKEIKKITPGSMRNSSDVYQSLVSSLWINNNIAGLVFYIGKDSKGIHIIQAIANTEDNLKLRKPYQENNDWTFLQQQAYELSNAVKEVNNLGIYCYYDDTNKPYQWHTKTDLDFTNAKNKQDFITTAMGFEKHYFYHCSLNSIIPGKDDILNGESSSLISLGQHLLK